MFEVSDRMFSRLRRWIRVTVEESVDSIVWVNTQSTGFWYIHHPKSGVQQFFFQNQADADRCRELWG